MKDGSDWCPWTDAPEIRKKRFGMEGAERDQGDPNDLVEQYRKKYNVRDTIKGDVPFTDSPKTRERMEAYRKDALEKRIINEKQ